MSTQPKIDLGGYNIREWALILLIVAVGTVIVVFAIGVALAMINDPTGIKFTGTIDLGQFTGIIIAMSAVAITLIAQQLTSKNQANAVASTDAVWLEEDKPTKPPGG